MGSLGGLHREGDIHTWDYESYCVHLLFMVLLCSTRVLSLENRDRLFFFF